MMLVLQLLAILLLTGSACSKDLLVGAFNIQIFGTNKVKKTDVMDALVKIIRRYDLLFIQEIRDTSGTAIKQLLNDVNKDQSEPFEMVLSERLGRSVSKEQYAYFYRPSSGLRVKKEFVYYDTKVIAGKAVDLFERQPFVVSFTSSQTELDSFALIGIHIAPTHAVKEINYLKTYVVNEVRKTLGEPNLMIMGDLNADCNYVSRSKWEHIPMKKDKSFKWLLDDHVDTTVKKTHCAYDRFITTGPGWDYGIVKNSSKVYRFDKDVARLGKIDYYLAANISDHYPIEFLLAETQFLIVSVSNKLYIKLYAEKGGLTVDDFYGIGLENDVLKVYDTKEQAVVGEVRKYSEDDKILTDELIMLMKRLKRFGSDLEVFIQPKRNRYGGKQKSRIVIPISVTEKSIAMIVWNALNINVCKLTYFICSKNGF